MYRVTRDLSIGFFIATGEELLSFYVVKKEASDRYHLSGQSGQAGIGLILFWSGAFQQQTSHLTWT